MCHKICKHATPKTNYPIAFKFGTKIVYVLKRNPIVFEKIQKQLRLLWRPRNLKKFITMVIMVVKKFLLDLESVLNKENFRTIVYYIPRPQK